VSPKGGQKRVGTRMGVAATFELGGREIVACSVHLESASDEPGRALQFRTLLTALDAYAGDRPVVIGGDLNTHVTAPNETLFADARARGYDWSRCNAGAPTTRPSVWSKGAGDCTLDWICTRGLMASDPAVIPAVAPDGTVLSDHDLVVVTLAVA
jgi:endonuclease/exonuclease/phosphatase family metal-dependent hydrolase